MAAFATAGVPQALLFAAIGIAAATLGVLTLVPKHRLLRLIARILAHYTYRFKTEGVEHIPDDGPAALACNHLSSMDAVLLMAASPRPIRFIMNHKIFATPMIGIFFKLAETIPIAGRNVDEATYEQAFAEADRALRNGELVGIFPEGVLSRDGELGQFRGGIMKILEANPVPVVPAALLGLWGSFFSLAGGRAMRRPFRRGVFNRVALRFGEPIAPAEMSPPFLRERVQQLMLAA